MCECGVQACPYRHPYRVQMSVSHQLAADERFDSETEAFAFISWWRLQPDLPPAIALVARADFDLRWTIPPTAELRLTLEPGVRDRFVGMFAATT